MNALRVKIWRKLAKYDPAKGRVFTFFSLLANQALAEVWAKKRLHQTRYNPTGIESLDHWYSTEPEVRQTENLDDLTWRIFRVKTTLSDSFELESQRWLVRGLVDSEFQLRRHDASDAMSIVYGLSPVRSRQIHDQTLVEIRRELLPITKIPIITKGNLRGTRQFALIKFANQLAPADFWKLVFLTRNLSPVAVIPAGGLHLVLHGHPDARPLF
jgi:hypothetical protein